MIFFFPTFNLNNGQDENAYKVDKCDNVDSYVDMKLEFDMHCVDLGVKEKNKSEVVFPNLQLVNESLIDDHAFSCLQKADIRCNQYAKLQPFYEEMFLSIL